MKTIRLTFLFFISITFLFCSRNQTENSNSIYSPIIDRINKKYDQAKNKQSSTIKRFKSIDEAISISKQNQIDSLLLKSISYKSTLYGVKKDYTNAIKTTEDLIAISNRLKDTSYLAKAYGKFGRYYYKQDKITEAYKHYYKSLNLYKAIKDSIKVAKQLRSIADIEKSFGDFISSEATCFRALKYLDTIQNPTQVAELYQIIAITAREQEDYKNALKYNERAIQLTKSKAHRNVYKNTKGVIYQKMKKYYDAINVYEGLITDSLVITKPKEKARILSNLAFTKSKLNYNWAKKELLEALKIRKKEKDIKGLIASNIHLSKYHIGKNKDSALEYANKAYEISKELKSISSIVESLDLIIEIESKSLNQLLEYKKISDSINSSNNLSKNQFARIRYETEEKEKENLILKTENTQNALSLQKKENESILYAGSGVLILISSFFIFFYLQTKHRKEKILERHSTEKRLSKKLHDEVGNDVFYLMSQLQQETHRSANSANNEIIHGLDAVYHKVRDFSRDHKIETGSEYGDELLSLLNSYGNQNIKVFTNTQKDDFWETVADYKKVELYWVLKELLTNMKKHSQATIVSVVITKEKKNIIVKYTDNGIGMDLNATQKHKNGLHNVENRIKDMKGTITFETKPQEGFKASIEFAP
ncbi:tetratricopeptide repeat-containing sensor histidine kinase [Aquimarina litoralis]|uniref:tetratricopeptide repeat-containing sensor histidine kinase n=1 Tax=Aquimarina litoralis TaxID=584605 RepID=UPI001C569671|nr:ATP-binding protein [Aquimarina litoralis]MBW1297025.1 hypothetical protein [Aquimarina litoralis]